MDRLLSKFGMAVLFCDSPRGMMTGEQAFVRQALGDGIDFSQVRIVRAAVIPLGREGMVLDSHIFLSEDYYLGDFSGGDEAEQGVLLRQMENVALSQQGVNMTWRGAKSAIAGLFGRNARQPMVQVGDFPVLDGREERPLEPF